MKSRRHRVWRISRAELSRRISDGVRRNDEIKKLARSDSTEARALRRAAINNNERIRLTHGTFFYGMREARQRLLDNGS